MNARVINWPKVAQQARMIAGDLQEMADALDRFEASSNPQEFYQARGTMIGIKGTFDGIEKLLEAVALFRMELPEESK